MNIKKIVSAVTAFALSATMFAGFSIQANAESKSVNVVNQNFNDLEALDNNYSKWVSNNIGTTNKDSLNLEGNGISLSTSTGTTTELQFVTPVGELNETTTMKFNAGKRSNGYYVAIPVVFYDSNDTALFSFVMYSNGSSNKQYYITSGNVCTDFGGSTTGLNTSKLANYTLVSSVAHTLYMDSAIEIGLTATSDTAATAYAKVNSGDAVELPLTTTSAADISKVVMGPAYGNRGSADQNRAWFIDNVDITGYVDVYSSTITLTNGTDAVTGAEVTIGGVVATETSGSYTVADLPAGTYEYTVSADGYSAKSGTVTVAAEGENTTAVTLESGVNVDLTIVDGAEVTVGTETKTSADGKVTFQLADGTYEVTATKDGYFNYTGELVVSGGVATSGATIDMVELYTITFTAPEAAKGTLSGNAAVTVNQDKLPDAIPSVVDTRNTIGGYVFKGWSATEGGAVVDPLTTAVTGDTVYYPVFSEQITYSKKFRVAQDSHIAGDGTLPNDSESIVLYKSNKRGFMNFDIDYTNAISSTINVYVNDGTAMDKDRTMNLTFDVAKRSGWSANDLTNDTWLDTVGGSGANIATIYVPVTTDGSHIGWNRADMTIGNASVLYLNQNQGVDLSFDSLEGNNPAYIEVFYTGEEPAAPALTVSKAITDYTDPTGENATKMLYNNEGTWEKATWAKAVGESEVTTLYIKVDNVADETIAPKVVLSDSKVCEPTRFQTTDISGVSYFVYQFVNIDLTGATVTYTGAANVSVGE